MQWFVKNVCVTALVRAPRVLLFERRSMEIELGRSSTRKGIALAQMERLQLLIQSALGNPEAFRGLFHVAVLLGKNRCYVVALHFFDRRSVKNNSVSSH